MALSPRHSARGCFDDSRESGSGARGGAAGRAGARPLGPAREGTLSCRLWARDGLGGPVAGMVRCSRDRQGGKSPPQPSAGFGLCSAAKLHPRVGRKSKGSAGPANPEPPPALSRSRGGQPCLAAAPVSHHWEPLSVVAARSPRKARRSADKQLTGKKSFGAPCQFRRSAVPQQPDEKVKNPGSNCFLQEKQLETAKPRVRAASAAQRFTAREAVAGGLCTGMRADSLAGDSCAIVSYFTAVV